MVLSLLIANARSLLFPSLLNEARPPQTEIDKARFGFDANSELTRLYQMEFIPAGFFSRILVRLLVLRWKPILVLCMFLKPPLRAEPRNNVTRRCGATALFSA